jgi:hypothetical protein
MLPVLVRLCRCNLSIAHHVPTAVINNVGSGRTDVAALGIADLQPARLASQTHWHFACFWICMIMSSRNQARLWPGRMTFSCTVARQLPRCLRQLQLCATCWREPCLLKLQANADLAIAVDEAEGVVLAAVVVRVLCQDTHDAVGRIPGLRREQVHLHACKHVSDG